MAVLPNLKKKGTNLFNSSLPTNQTAKTAEPGGTLDAENVCGLKGKFGCGASDLDVLLPEEEGWRTIKDGQVFEVPAQSNSD